MMLHPKINIFLVAFIRAAYVMQMNLLDSLFNDSLGLSVKSYNFQPEHEYNLKLKNLFIKNKNACLIGILGR